MTDTETPADTVTILEWMTRSRMSAERATMQLSSEWVTVAGETVTDPATQVRPHDTVVIRPQ